MANDDGNIGLTRRSFAAWCGAAAGVALAAPASDAAAAESFRAWCAALTGFDESALDAGFARALGEAFDLASPPEPGAATTPETAALETDVISAWYSGVLPGERPVVATLYGALIWSAADFATPPGVCAAANWSEAPK